LQITIANGNERTLLPKTNFTQYVLEFSGPAVHAAITLTGGETFVTVTDLANGTWNITAKGYVTINGMEYAAAEGTKQVTVSSGTFQGVTIPISASMSSADGFFSYSISFPQGKVNYASLSIGAIDSSQTYYSSDLLTTPAGTDALSPGYYMMRIQLQTDFETARRTEVVHIYSNMETAANYHFTESDFSPLITLSGTANITVNGQPLPSGSSVYVYAYSDPNLNNQVEYTDFDPSSGNTWTMTMAAFDTATTLYFEVRTYVNGSSLYKNTGVSRTVSKQNVSGINLGNINTITLSGMVNITLNGQPLPSNWRVHVSAYSDPNFNNGVGDTYFLSSSSNTWTMSMEPFATATTLYFWVSVEYYDFVYDSWFGKNTGISRTVSNQNVSGINLGNINFTNITLSGTVNVTVNGQPLPSGSGVHVYAYSITNEVGYAYIDTTSDGNTWTMGMEPFDTATTLYFEVGVSVNGSWFGKNTGISRTVSNQNVSGINLGNININFTNITFTNITLSGTANITVNGQSSYNSGMSVYAYSDPNFNNRVGVANLYQYNTWTMTMAALDTATTLYFEVRGSVNGLSFNKNTGVSRTVSNQNVSDINLAVNINTIILSGTVNVTLNGQPPDYAEVSAYSDPNFSNAVGSAYFDPSSGNTWIMAMATFDTPTTLYFQVRVSVNDRGFSKNTGVSRTASNQDVSGINLGNINFSVITLSGTVNITVNGQPPDYASVYAYSDPNFNNWVGGAYDLSNGNTWTMAMESFATATTLYFRVAADVNGLWFDKNTGVSRTVRNQNVSGINLTVNSNTITLSGTVNVTVNGQPLDYPPVYAYSDPNFNNQVGVASLYQQQYNTWTTWTMLIEPFATATTLYFRVETYLNGSWVEKNTGVSRTVSNQNVSGINITVNFTD